MMNRTTTGKVIDAVLSMFSRHGVPFSLKSDNGPQFINSECADFLKEHGIAHRHSSPLWPQANGEVEAQNRSLVKTL